MSPTGDLRDALPDAASGLPASGPPSPPCRCPALTGLGLTARDLELLSEQGSLQPDLRGGRRRYKLRWRRGARQVVRCVGRAEVALRVREELAGLQAGHRARRRLDRLRRDAARVLRATKQVLKPRIAAAGYVFHGLAIRKPRRRPASEPREPPRPAPSKPAGEPAEHESKTAREPQDLASSTSHQEENEDEPTSGKPYRKRRRRGGAGPGR